MCTRTDCALEAAGGSGCQTPPLRRCPLIPCPAPRIAHSSTAVPRDLHWRDEDSQAQRTGLFDSKASAQVHSGELYPWSFRFFSHLAQPRCLSVSSLVSPPSPSQLPSALCPLCLAKFMGGTGEACPGCLHPCRDHGLPFANLFGFFGLFVLIHQIYLGSVSDSPLPAV